jgi:outer membrane receptor protein involved in Fe transport
VDDFGRRLDVGCIVSLAPGYLGVCARPPLESRPCASKATIPEAGSVSTAAVESVVVTGADRAQRLSDSTKTQSVIDSEEMEARDEYFVPEAIRTIPGVRMEQLGGPGSFTSLKIRGLRTEDTAILIDGARLRDPSAPQGDASSSSRTSRAEPRPRQDQGSGLVLAGRMPGRRRQYRHRLGAVNRRESLVEGGLGFFRGGASVSGGVHDRFLYSVGASHVNVSEGVDGDDESRNTSFQGRALLQMTPYSSLSFRFYGSDAQLALNESPATLGTLPEGIAAIRM